MQENTCPLLPLFIWTGSFTVFPDRSPYQGEKDTTAAQQGKEGETCLYTHENLVPTSGVIMTRPTKTEMITIAIPMDNIWPTRRIVRNDKDNPRKHLAGERTRTSRRPVQIHITVRPGMSNDSPRASAHSPSSFVRMMASIRIPQRNVH